MEAIHQFFREEQQRLNSFVFRMTNNAEDTARYSSGYDGYSY